LNGVAVNLEVVRSRLARAGATAEAAAPFAASAGDQLERVSGFVEALLALARPARAPADVAALLRGLAALLEPVAAASHIPWELTTYESGEPGARATRVDAQAARLVLAAALLSATAPGAGGVVCAASLDGPGDGDPDAVVVRITSGGRAPPLGEDVAQAAAAAGVGVRVAPDALTLTFPSAAG
jgi:hypothetical protein